MDATAPNLVAATLARLPGLMAALKRCGEQTLAEYSQTFFPPPVRATIDPLDDFLDAAYDRAAPLLGEKTARNLREQLERSPSVLTANHHGLDTLHQSVHSSIAFALPALLQHNDAPRILPVLACAGVPLGSVTYPRGIVLSKKPDLTNTANPAKTRIPFFPHSMRTCMAHAAPAISAQQFRKAMKSSQSLMNEGVLTHSQNSFLQTFISTDCLHPTVFGRSTFAEQAVILNALLWPRLFAPDVREDAPPLAYLDLESVVITLLERDLRRDSLIASLLFDSDIRDSLLTTLDGAAGCWSLERQKRLRAFPETTKLRHDDLRGAGACFFWMIDDSGRQLPMWLENSPRGPVLTGRSMDGVSTILDFAPEPILQALAEKRISPSLFTSYATLAMARGVRCWGGVYQADYLRAMQRGVAQARGSHGSLPADDEQKSNNAPRADHMANAPCDCFLAGLITAFTAFPGDEPLHERIAPACAPDIAAAGGLTREQIVKMSRLTMTQANIAGLLQTYEEITPTAERKEGWYGEICRYVAGTTEHPLLHETGEAP